MARLGRRGGRGRRRRTLFVAEEDGRWLGVVGAFVRVDPREVQLISMWVDPGARGRGIARDLIRAVARWAQERGSTQVVLFVQEANEPAQQLYERAGFRPTGDRAPAPAGRSAFKLVLAASADELLGERVAFARRSAGRGRLAAWPIRLRARANDDGLSPVTILVLLRSESRCCSLPARFCRAGGRTAIADQANGSFTSGIGLGLFYGFAFTLGRADRPLDRPPRIRSWKGRLILLAVALLIASPNLLTLGIVSARAAARTQANARSTSRHPDSARAA